MSREENCPNVSGDTKTDSHIDGAGSSSLSGGTEGLEETPLLLDIDDLEPSGEPPVFPTVDFGSAKESNFTPRKIDIIHTEENWRELTSVAGWYKLSTVGEKSVSLIVCEDLNATKQIAFAEGKDGQLAMVIPVAEYMSNLGYELHEMGILKQVSHIKESVNVADMHASFSSRTMCSTHYSVHWEAYFEELVNRTLEDSSWVNLLEVRCLNEKIEPNDRIKKLCQVMGLKSITDFLKERKQFEFVI